MQTSTKLPSRTFHMSLVEPTGMLVISLLGIAFAMGLFWSGIGDLIKTIVLFLISLAGLVFAFRMTRKLEIADSELIISHLVTKRIIAREDIDAYFLDEQGWNRRTRAFVTIHLVDGQRVRFKGIKEGNESLLQALESFTGLKQAVEPSQ
jgi:cbb3-type cytochrome oxidase subunit 3